MRVPVMVLMAYATLAGTLSAQTPPAQTPPAQTPSRQELESEAVRSMRRIGSMSQLMVHLIYPTSNAVFYIETRTPTTDAEWGELEAKTLMFGEAGLDVEDGVRGRVDEVNHELAHAAYASHRTNRFRLELLPRGRLRRGRLGRGRLGRGRLGRQRARKCGAG